MTKEEMRPGQEIDLGKKVRMEVGAAMNLHTQAKSIAHIDEMKQENTMRRLLGLTQTREGLDALIALNGEKSSQE